MKRFFLALLMGVTMISCSKDENNSIEGTWVAESFTYTENGVEKTRKPQGCEAKNTITFSNGKSTSVYFTSDGNDGCKEESKEVGSYTISGNKITSKDENGEEKTVEFSVSGNTLTIVGENIKFVFKRK